MFGELKRLIQFPQKKKSDRCSKEKAGCEVSIHVLLIPPVFDVMGRFMWGNEKLGLWGLQRLDSSTRLNVALVS